MEDKYKQLCVWYGTTLGNTTPQEFESEMSAMFGGIRFKFAEEVITNGSIERNEEGGRHDLLFFVHEDDVIKFAVPRLKFCIRWWEDVVKYNNNSYLYSDEVLQRYPVRW